MMIPMSVWTVFRRQSQGGWAFEVQWGFVGSHWQDNMVQRFHICRSRDHFFFCVLEFFWKWLSARAWGCIDLFYPVESHRNNYSKQLATLTSPVFFARSTKTAKCLKKYSPRWKASTYCRSFISFGTLKKRKRGRADILPPWMWQLLP